MPYFLALGRAIVLCTARVAGNVRVVIFVVIFVVLIVSFTVFFTVVPLLRRSCLLGLVSDGTRTPLTRGLVSLHRGRSVQAMTTRRLLVAADDAAKLGQRIGKSDRKDGDRARVTGVRVLTRGLSRAESTSFLFIF